MDLDRVVRDARADLRGEQLGLRRDEPEVAALVLEPGGSPDEAARRLDLGRHVGDHERHALERADRPAELLARLRVRDRRVERALGDPDRQRTDRDPAAIEDPQERLEAAPLLAEHVRRRDARPVEDQLAGRRGMQPELVLEPPDREAGRVGGHDERADLGGAVVARPAPGGDDVGARLAGVGDEPLAAVEHPRAAVRAVLVARGRPRPARIAAGSGLGQAVRADDLAARHRHEVALLLLVRAGQVERPAAEARVGRDDQPERAPHAADLLDRDGVRERVQPRPALVLRDRDAQPAELADAAHDLGSGSAARARARR